MGDHQPNQIEERCAARGLRMTAPRRVIARVLAEAVDHPDVEELHRRVMRRDPGIALSTVYRTLRLFVDEGIVERHEFRDGRSRYESASEAHHDHLIDLHSGHVIEFESPEIEALQAEVARTLGYRIVGHRLQLFCVPLAPDTPRPRGRKRVKPEREGA